MALSILLAVVIPAVLLGFASLVFDPKPYDKKGRK